MYRPLPDNAHKVEAVRVSPWIPAPEDTDFSSMRFIEGTDPNVIANRVSFITKTPRVRAQPFNNDNDDWRNWHCGWKGDEGEAWDKVAQGWCDTHLLAMGYVVPDARPYDDSML
jgi:hypothetical protein